MYDFAVVSQSPTGVVSQVVSGADVYFNDAVDPASVFASAFSLTTPDGALASSNLTVAVSSANVVHVGFPPQNINGVYTLGIAAVLTNLFGLELAESYSGSFEISLPLVSGMVTNVNGAPVAGVQIQAGNLPATTTDANGNYSVGVPPGWSGVITPSGGMGMFVPASLAVTDATNSVSGENFLTVSTIAPGLTTSLDSSNNLSIGWLGLAGINYQAFFSTNLVTWLPYGTSYAGSNGPIQVSFPSSNAPAMFFRIKAGY